MADRLRNKRTSHRWGAASPCVPLSPGAARQAGAAALRTRWRRPELTGQPRKVVTPKDMIMVGPVGVGKTEIAGRLAQLVGAPFLKVEATQYPEAGSVGRDVASMIRDL